MLLWQVVSLTVRMAAPVFLAGMGIWTMPGYAFHFTVSLGFNIAESANMFLELGGWTLEKLWLVCSEGPSVDTYVGGVVLSC